MTSLRPTERTVAWVLATSLLVMGAAVEVIAVVPVRVGNFDWEFGTLGEVAATAPLFLIGSAGTLFVATRARRTLAVMASAALSLIGAGLISAGFVILALDVPIIIRAAAGLAPEAGRSVMVVLGKTAALLLIELVTLFCLGALGLRWWRTLRRLPLGKGAET